MYTPVTNLNGGKSIRVYTYDLSSDVLRHKHTHPQIHFLIHTYASNPTINERICTYCNTQRSSPYKVTPRPHHTHAYSLSHTHTHTHTFSPFSPSLALSLSLSL